MFGTIYKITNIFNKKVYEIKLLFLNGVSQKEIAKKYNITQSYVSRIVNSRRNY